MPGVPLSVPESQLHLQCVPRCKARFFESLGFSIEQPERLMAALRALAENGDVVENAHSVHGEKYVVEWWLSAHTGESRRRLVRTVWIIDLGREAPRLVTAYPGRSKPSA